MLRAPRQRLISAWMDGMHPCSGADDLEPMWMAACNAATHARGVNTLPLGGGSCMTYARRYTPLCRSHSPLFDMTGCGIHVYIQCPCGRMHRSYLTGCGIQTTIPYAPAAASSEREACSTRGNLIKLAKERCVGARVFFSSSFPFFFGKHRPHLDLSLPQSLVLCVHRLGGGVGALNALTTATHGALPHRAPSPRCTADPVHRVWHRRLLLWTYGLDPNTGGDVLHANVRPSGTSLSSAAHPAPHAHGGGGGAADGALCDGLEFTGGHWYGKITYVYTT